MVNIGVVASQRKAAPNAPTIGTASDVGTGMAFNNAQATVTFTPPAFNGKLPVSLYTVTSSPGSFTGTGSSSPISVAGLQSGTSYTFTTTATNAIGTSVASSATSAITATTVPQAPTIGTATDGGTGTTATVGFTANANGGKNITSYTATSSPGGITGTGASSPITVSGLTAGTAYTFTVTATNANGTSTASAASNSVTPAIPTSFESIATITLTSNSSSATFSGIPSTYKHLQIRCFMYATLSGAVAQARLNNDSSSSYSWHKISGGYITSGSGTGGNSLGTYLMVFGPTQLYGMVSGNENVAVIDIFDYANTSSYKTAMSKGGMVTPNAQGDYTLSSGSWRSTAAVDTVSLHCANGLFVTGTKFALYGIKDS